MVELRLDDGEARILARFVKKHLHILLRRGSADDGYFLLSEAGTFLAELVGVLESELKFKEANNEESV